MKKMTLLLTVILFYNHSFSQDRQGSSLPVIDTVPLWTLNQATGWMKNAEGQWLEGKNKIQLFDASAANKDAWNEGKYKMGYDNFFFMRVYPITIDGNRFYLFIKALLTSDYQYSITGTGSVRSKVLYAVFSRKLETKSKTEGKEPFDKYQTSIYYSGELNYSRDFLQQVALGINTVKSPDITENVQMKSKFTLWYRPLDDGKNCRFFLDEESNKTAAYFTPVTRLLDLRVSGVETLYFECPKERLEKLLALLK